jgi:signal transduction histidine kinase
MAMASEVNPMIQYIRKLESLSSAPYMSVNTQYRLIPFAGPSGTFPTYSYVDVMLNQVPTDAFRDKTVLIGATAPGLGDIIPTPVSQVTNPMSGVELHANAYSALITNTAIRPVEKLWAYLLTFAFILIPILVFPRLKPTYVMPFSMLLVAFVLLFSYGLLALDETWFPPINSVIGILLAYPLWSWQRMRHLNGFLNNELEKLQKEPAISFRDTSQHNAETLFYSLKSLLKPIDYVLIKNKEVLDKTAHTSQQFEILDTNQHWFHHDNLSVLSMKKQLTKHSHEEFFIGFRWRNESNLKETQHYLNKLQLENKSISSKKHYYEKIANRISQVREAISSMQDMRTFISKGFEEIPNAVIVTDPLGVIVFANSHAQSWFEKNDLLVGHSVYTLFDSHVFNQLNDKISSVLLESKQSNVELQLNSRDILIHCSPFLVDEKSDSGMMLTFSDITQIREQQREKNQLIDFLSHDVRSPLVSQLAMLDSIAKGNETLSKDLIPKLVAHAQRSLNLSDQFLQITRAEQTTDDQFYEFDLVNAVENSIDSLIAQAKPKEIDINFIDFDPIWIKGNAELMERALTNLLSNSIKYSPEKTQITITIKRQNDAVRIDIIDQGFGIDVNELPHIFKRFHRQKTSEVSGNKGAGLGLSFVKVVIDKHQGNISVQSEKDAGTTFSITLPALSE